MRRAAALYGMLLAGVVAAACGGAAQNGAVVGSSMPGATSSASATPSATATGTPTTTAPAGSATPMPAQSPEVVEMKAPIPTAMAADLQALGLDVNNLPPIEKLEPKTLRGVMKLFARSLGAKCGDCHTAGDFAAPTRRKKIAAKMWDEFVAKLSLGPEQGPQASNQSAGTAPPAATQPLFCDSCHQGRIKQLDRSDKKALGKWMDANFVQRLVRKDGKDEECESCHVDWDMTFLTKWGGG